MIKPRPPKRGTYRAFTLVEIMIVIVVIGLLAAMAIPAFKKVRNSSIEKTLINDARVLSAAAMNFLSENPGETVVAVSRFIGPGKEVPHLSSGVVIYEGLQNARIATPVQSALSGIRFASPGEVTYRAAKIFALCHPEYRTGSSDSRNISDTTRYDADSNLLNFAVDNGELLDNAGRRIQTNATLSVANGG